MKVNRYCRLRRCRTNKSQTLSLWLVQRILIDAHEWFTWRFVGKGQR